MRHDGPILSSLNPLLLPHSQLRSACRLLTPSQQRPQRFPYTPRHTLRRDLVSRPVDPDLREATHSLDLILSLLEDRNLVHDRAVANFDDTQSDVQHAGIMCCTEIVAVAICYQADVFGLRCAVATVLDEVAVDDGINQDAIYGII